MVFSGIQFLFYFLPLLLAVYYVSPNRWRNYVLLAFSLLFYAVGEPVYILLMLASAVQTYFFAILIEGERGKRKKGLLICTLVLSLAPLIVCKYSGFILENLSLIIGTIPPKVNIRLPLGISFYTFQLIGYSADVYRGSCTAQKSLIKLLLYVSLFPQLVAGPIVRYSDISHSLDSREHSAECFARGIGRFSIGLSKKLIIANVLGELCGQLNVMTAAGAWGYAVSASLQIYYDFSGYSDMAIGLGRMFGFDFPENFNYPYIAKSISEFWRRWHMTLGSWFRDYVYIPMGGNRVSRARWVLNILTVWMLTGLWHGAEWNFVLWGLYYALLLAAEKSLSGIYTRLPSFVRRTLTLLLITVSFIIFDSADITALPRRLYALFDFASFSDTATLYYLRSYGMTVIAAGIGATPVISDLFRKIKNPAGARIAEWTAVLASLVISSAYLVDGSFNPFLYFRF